MSGPTWLNALTLYLSLYSEILPKQQPTDYILMLAYEHIVLQNINVTD